LKANAAVYKVHKWLGLLTGAVLVVIGLTGSVVVFYDEIDRLQFSHLSTVAPGEMELPLETRFEAARKARPDVFVYALLYGATVEVQGARGEPVAAATTKIDGSFEVEVPAGTYTVTVWMAGFSVWRQPIVAGETLPTLRVVLEPAPFTEEVSVTATRKEGPIDRAPQPVSVATRSDIEMRQPVNPTEILASLPGVHFTDSGPFRPRPVLRGLDSNRLLVLVDGERLNNSRTSTSNAGIEPSLVDVEQIERIEVVRGAGSVLHGSDAMAGVINIITRAPSRPAEAELSGSLVGEYHSVRDGGRFAGAAGMAASSWAFRLGGSFGRFQDYESGFGPVPNSGAEESNLEATFSLWMRERDSLRVQWTGRNGRDVGVPGTTEESGFLASFPFDDRDKLAVFYRRADGNGALGELQAHGYWQRQNRNFYNLVAAPGFSLESSTETDTRSTGFDVQLTRLGGARHQLTYGAAFFSDGNRDLRDGSGDVSRSHVLWTADATADFASPLATDHCVYFINPTGGLTCVDPASGRALWKYRLSGPAWASPIVLGSHVYVFTKSGITEVFEDRAQGPVALATSSLPVGAEDDALYGVAVSESSILMRTASRLYCVRAGASGATRE
jgi:hemoglobin/transferrin/lactoferrin receptor protein